MASAKWNELASKIGGAGIVLSLVSTARFFWNLVGFGGNVQTLAKFMAWFWTLLGKSYVLYPTWSAGVGLILWALLRKPSNGGRDVGTLSSKVESRTIYRKGDIHGSLENLPLIHLSALQFIYGRTDVSESELRTYLTERGFEVPHEYFSELMKRVGETVERTDGGRLKVHDAFKVWLGMDLPKFRLGRVAERDLRDQHERELAGELAKRKEMERLFGQARIFAAGQAKTSRNLTVAVEFVNPDPDDIVLAERIKALFEDQLNDRSPWTTRNINQTRWFENPSGSRIVMLSRIDDVIVSVRAAFNDLNLIGERCGSSGPIPENGLGPMTEMPPELRIVIFPK